MHLSRSGVLLAVISGAVTSGLGYVIWYRALRGLSSRLAVSAAPVLGRIAVAVMTRQTGDARSPHVIE
jgi:drug/metabolite transporter (DMT)-like permease